MRLSKHKFFKYATLIKNDTLMRVIKYSLLNGNIRTKIYIQTILIFLLCINYT